MKRASRSSFLGFREEFLQSSEISMKKNLFFYSARYATLPEVSRSSRADEHHTRASSSLGLSSRSRAFAANQILWGPFEDVADKLTCTRRRSTFDGGPIFAIGKIATPLLGAEAVHPSVEPIAPTIFNLR